MASKASPDAHHQGPTRASATVVTAQKTPPPESAESTRTRRYIVLAFWLVVVLLGLPLWWKTTTVYRAALPLADMISWADGKMYHPNMQVLIDINAPALEPADETMLAQSVGQHLHHVNQRHAHSIHSFIVAPTDRTGGLSTAPAMTVSLIPSKKAKDPSARLSPYSAHPLLEVEYRDGKYGQQRDQIEQLVAKSLEDIFTAEQALAAHLLSTLPSFASQAASYANDNATMLHEFEKRRTRSMRYASTYHLTFSLFTPEAQPSGWEIEQALASTMAPLLSGLAPISNFTIDTQVQPYAVFSQSVQPLYDDSRKAWQLRSSDLGGFINAAEWPLSPSIGAGPTINFILYVPSPSQTPLVIEDNESTSWLIRQWGGIAVYNPKSPDQLQKRGSLSAAEMREPLLTFSQHLLDLLGLPASDWPFQLRLATQTRLLTLRLVSSASSTLGSLARLTEELPSISIPESVAEAVSATISHLKASNEALNSGRFQEALEHARVADEEVERAFFHKSMVGQVYFPDEHKVAVYLPMLGPMAVPLIMTAVRELKAMRGAPGKP